MSLGQPDGDGEATREGVHRVGVRVPVGRRRRQAAVGKQTETTGVRHQRGVGAHEAVLRPAPEHPGRRLPQHQAARSGGDRTAAGVHDDGSQTLRPAILPARQLGRRVAAGTARPAAAALVRPPAERVPELAVHELRGAGGLERDAHRLGRESGPAEEGKHLRAGGTSGRAGGG
uniref:(northern house mosquito) hypothetical protein n=1 Tax=Culex pipiens TaxID=7175 RepID=A0A8D8KVH2_CULPI